MKERSENSEYQQIRQGTTTICENRTIEELIAKMYGVDGKLKILLKRSAPCLNTRLRGR